jgi:hypothetical protein
MIPSVECRRLAMMIGHVPDEASPLVQVVRGSEREHGVHAIILRQPVSERRVLERLGLAVDKVAERRAGVYVQITRPGEPFISFHLAQRKFFLPLWFYLELLEFFAPAGQYLHLQERAQRDIANMLLLREPVSLGVVTGFYHHGKIRYLFPFTRSSSSAEQQSAADTIYIWMTVDSKSPEGREPECWISSCPEKQEHQIPVAPFLELAKYASHELKPWLPDHRDAGGEIPFVALVATASFDPSVPQVIVSETSAGTLALAADQLLSPGPLLEDVPYDASAAMDTLERICTEVALKIREPPPPQQQQQESPRRVDSKPSSSDASGSRKRGASSSSSGGRGGRGSGANKKERNPYLSPASTISSAASSRSSSVNRSSQKGGRSGHGYFTNGGGGSGSGGHNDRYKDPQDAKRNRQ